MKNFKDYAILGDDIVIQNDVVAKEYVKLIEHLGLSINLSKSVISTRFAEFAKVLKSPYINYTPVGPGLILRFLRDKGYYGALMTSLHSLGIIQDIHALLQLFTSNTITNSGYMKLVNL